MIIILALFILLIPSFGNSLSFEVMVINGKIIVQKYDLNGTPVFSDIERDKMISDSVDTGTGSITNDDFTLIVISTHTLDIIDELNATSYSGKGARTSAMKEVMERGSTGYNLLKMAENESLLIGYESLSRKGFNTTSEEDKIKLQIEKYSGRNGNPVAR